MIEIPHEWMPWLLYGLWVVGLVSACKAGVMADRGDVWRDDK